MRKLFLLLILISQVSIGQVKTWTGATSTAWADDNNWSPVGVPTTANDVTIPSAPSNQPTITINNATALMVYVQSGATLTLASSGVLAPVSSTSINVSGNWVEGSLINFGTVENNGTITIRPDYASSCIYNNAIFNNNSGSTLTIEDA